MRNATLIMLLFALLLHYCSVSQFDLSSQKVPGRARIELPLVKSHDNGLYNAILYVGGVGYYLVLDTGSSLSWIQCVGPHVKPAYNLPYEPHNNQVAKRDPECPNHSSSAPPNDLCDFRLSYADGGSCFGVMIRDNVQLYDRNSSRLLNTQQVLGCGEYLPSPTLARERLNFDGVLGLGAARSSFTSLLVSHGLTNNFFGHCLSSNPSGVYSGYIFFGNGGVSQTSNDVVWLPFQQSFHDHYVIGPATLTIEGPGHGWVLPSILVDSGSTYTYFNSLTHTYINDMIQLNLNQSRAPLRLVHQPGSHMHVCWKPDHGITDYRITMMRYFKPIKLDFQGNTIIVLQPTDYLTVAPSGHICLSILDSNGTTENVLGALSMLNRLVMYDNERHILGWSITSITCKYRHRTATDLETGVFESIPTNASINAVHGTSHD